MSLNSALARARKRLATIQKEKDMANNLNQCIVCTEWNEPLDGQLVIILNTDHEDAQEDISDYPLR